MPGEKTPPTEGEEKRKFPRVKLDVRLRATVRKGGNRVPVQGRGSNLSEGGLAAFLPVELGIGDFIELDVILPYATQPMKLRAVVRNRRSFTYGMEFVDTTAAQKSVIARACGALGLIE